MPISNDTTSSAPIFKSIFGEAWDNLPPVIQKHYANRPYSNDLTQVEGSLEVMCKGPIKWLSPLLELMGQIPARNETDVPCHVDFKSVPKTAAFHFYRTFHFRNRQAPYVFHSRMVQYQADEVIEIMPFNIGWRLSYGWENNKVTLKHRGYVLRLFGGFIPLPLAFLLGRGYAEETAIDDNTFTMSMHVMHPWWGKVYGYAGTFQIKTECNELPNVSSA